MAALRWVLLIPRVVQETQLVEPMELHETAEGAAATKRAGELLERVGIPAAALPHLFDRLPIVASRPAKGDRSGRGQLGLGLSIARHLAELHGGGLSAASEGPGRGATFTLRVPLRGAADDGRAEEPAPALAQDLRLEGRRVLVVADPAGRDAMVRTLSERGADVAAAGSSDEALREVVAFAPDAMIVDLEMREDGCELMRRVRALGDEDSGRTPALALTSHGGADDRLRTLRAGFQIHVAKPVHPLELATVVASLVARAPQRHGARAARTATAREPAVGFPGARARIADGLGAHSTGPK